MSRKSTKRRRPRVQMFYGCLALSAVLAAGCDPGYVYQPTGGRNQQIGDVRFDMEPWMTLTGSGNELQNLTIENGSGQDVVILGAELVTAGQRLQAELPGSGEPKWRTVGPGTTDAPFLYWDYGDYRSAGDVLGPEIEWVWRVEVEGEEHVVRFTMKRE